MLAVTSVMLPPCRRKKAAVVIDFENLDPLPAGALDLAPNAAISLKSRVAVQTLLPPDLHYQVGCMHSAGLGASVPAAQTLLLPRLDDPKPVCQRLQRCRTLSNVTGRAVLAPDRHHLMQLCPAISLGRLYCMAWQLHQAQEGRQAGIHQGRL